MKFWTENGTDLGRGETVTLSFSVHTLNFEFFSRVSTFHDYIVCFVFYLTPLDQRVLCFVLLTPFTLINNIVILFLLNLIETETILKVWARFIEEAAIAKLAKFLIKYLVH